MLRVTYRGNSCSYWMVERAEGMRGTDGEGRESACTERIRRRKGESKGKITITASRMAERASDTRAAGPEKAGNAGREGKGRQEC